MTFETDRLIIKKHTKGDIPSLVTLLKDRDVPAYTFLPYPYTMTDAEQFITRVNKSWKQGDLLYMGVYKKDTRELIGSLSLGAIRQKHKRLTIAYWLGKAYRKQGYMSEAVKAVITHYFYTENFHKIIADVIAGNNNSEALLMKLGFVKEGVLRSQVKHRNRWKDIHTFGLLKEEYKK